MIFSNENYLVSTSVHFLNGFHSTQDCSNTARYRVKYLSMELYRVFK